MPAEIVVDASVAAKVFITEDGSAAARSLFQSGVRTIAPDLVILELTNVAVRRLRRGDIPRIVADRMTVSVRSMYEELAATSGLVARAFVLAADFGISTYDATYVALAERRACDLVTADLRLISRAAQAGLSINVRTP